MAIYSWTANDYTTSPQHVFEELVLNISTTHIVSPGYAPLVRAMTKVPDDLKIFNIPNATIFRTNRHQQVPDNLKIVTIPISFLVKRSFLLNI